MTTYSELVNEIIGIINVLVPAIFGILFFYLVWKVIDSWVIHVDDETKRQEGKQYLVTAVIVLVVMISVWGLVNLIRTSLFG